MREFGFGISKFQQVIDWAGGNVSPQNIKKKRFQNSERQIERRNEPWCQNKHNGVADDWIQTSHRCKKKKQKKSIDVYSKFPLIRLMMESVVLESASVSTTTTTTQRNREEKITIQPLYRRDKRKLHEPQREIAVGWWFFSLLFLPIFFFRFFLTVVVQVSLFLFFFYVFRGLPPLFLFCCIVFLSPPAEMTELRVSCISVVVVVAAGSFTHSSRRPSINCLQLRVACTLSFSLSGISFCVVSL